MHFKRVSDSNTIIRKNLFGNSIFWKDMLSSCSISPYFINFFSSLFIFIFFIFSLFFVKTQSSTRQILIRPQLSNSLSRLTFAIAHHNWERFIVSQTSNRDMVFRYWRRRNNWRAILCLPHHVVKQRRYIVTYVSRTDHTRNHFLVGSGPSAAVQYPDH